jgi:hypothetical protein
MPSIARLKRLQRLEARQPRGRPWTDPFDAAMALWAAFDAEHVAAKAGREFSRLPRPERELSEAEQAAFELLMREVDSMHRRLKAETPEAA